MTEIYLIRHAQSVGNLYRMMQGHWDGAVTELGVRQIAALAERFKDVPVDALYSSDLYRARLTAEAIRKYRDIPLHTDRELREMNLGPWEGKFFGDLAHDEYEKMYTFVKDTVHWKVDGAETCMEVAERMARAVVSIAEANDGKTVAIVSHGVSIRCFLGFILQNADAPISTNTGVTHLYYENGQFTADYVNDNAHLGDMDSPIWNNTPDLRGESFDPASDPSFYKNCYRDAWLTAHGDLRGFDAENYYLAALEHSVIRILDRDDPVGIIDLDTHRSAHIGCGWISLLWLREDHRHIGCGIQLLARAMQFYEQLGRSSVRLCVAEENKNALAFYRKYGFHELSHENTGRGRLLLMEKKLGGHGDV